MRPLRTTAVLVLVALLGAVTACGGDDDDGGGGDGDALTKAEYIAEADEICQDNLDDGNDLEVPEEGDVEGLARYLDEAVDIFEETRDRFEALHPPADAQEVHEGQLSQLDAAVDLLSDAQAAAEDGDLQGAAELVANVDYDETADQLAAEYGLEVCGTQDAG